LRARPARSFDIGTDSRKIFEADAEIEVVAEAADGLEAVEGRATGLIPSA
jgi:hypothetical protein